jgi:hypothetical protein
MRVDQIGERFRAKRCEGGLHVWLRDRDAGVDHHLAVLSGQHGNVATGTLQHGDVAPQLKLPRSGVCSGLTGSVMISAPATCSAIRRS